MPPVLGKVSPSQSNAQVRPYARFGIDPVVPLKDAAVVAGVHAQTLKNECRRGRIVLIRVSERRIGIRKSELNRYLDSRIWAA